MVISPRPSHFLHAAHRWSAALAVLCAWHTASMGQTSPALDFDGALRAAQQNSPVLRARAATTQGAAALQTSAALLPDPKLSVGIADFPVSGPAQGSQKIGFTQDVPNRAKRAARADVALARTDKERAMERVEALAVRRETGLAWLARFYAEKRLSLIGTLLSEQSQLVDTAPAQYAAGKSNASAVPMARLDALALADRRDELQREVEQARVQLQRWVGAAASAALVGNVPEQQVDGAHLQASLERSPEIAAFAPAEALAQAEIREADAAKVGDWGWGVSYGRRGQGYSDLVSVQFTFELPLAPNERQQPLVHAKRKELERLAGERADLLRKYQQELDTLLAEHDEANRKLTRLVQEAQPLATQRSALTLAAYESGRDTLSAVLEARKQQTELRLRALELQAKRAAVQWRLNTLTSE
jgi:outer membrane protein TolC